MRGNATILAVGEGRWVTGLCLCTPWRWELAGLTVFLPLVFDPFVFLGIAEQRLAEITVFIKWRDRLVLLYMFRGCQNHRHRMLAPSQPTGQVQKSSKSPSLSTRTDVA